MGNQDDRDMQKNPSQSGSQRSGGGSRSGTGSGRSGTGSDNNERSNPQRTSEQRDIDRDQPRGGESSTQRGNPQRDDEQELDQDRE